MSNEIKDINTKNTYYFFDNIINIKDFNPNNIKIDENSYKNILIYYIGYVMIKKDLKIYSASPLHHIFSDVNGYFKKVNEYKYLTLVPTNEKVWRIVD